MFLENGSENASPLVLHFILPPNFASAWSKPQVMLVTEVELGGARVQPVALRPNERYACDPHDLAALDGFREFFPEDELLAAMRLYPREKFLRLLRSFRGHPRVSFGKAKPAAIAAENSRPLLHLRASLMAELSAPLLIAGPEAWLLEGETFRPLPENFPEEFRFLADGRMKIRAERVASLREWFTVESDFPLPEPKLARPQFLLALEGSLREVRATLRVRYAEADWEGPLARASEQVLVSRADAILLRDLTAESAALARLERLGFDERLVLKREEAVARFFAFEYPRLREQWTVTLSAQATKAQAELQPLAPQIEVVASGENWFEIQYSLGTPDGTQFSAAELQRLLRSGQTKTKLRNGRTAVFDPEAMADFEEMLRDTDPTQKQPGLYRISRAHSDYLATTAQAIGADVRGALQSLTNAVALPPLGEIGGKLRDYQREGVAWLWRLGQGGLGGILADEMGLGKTVQTLAFLEAAKTKEPALIVCPSSLVTNWRNEAQRWTPSLRVLVLEGPQRHERFAEISRHDLVLTSYALLQRDAERYRALQFSTVVLDEAQHIKNPDTQNAQAAFALQARRRFVLTGTPIENSVRDLWSIMNFALPGYLGNAGRFSRALRAAARARRSPGGATAAGAPAPAVPPAPPEIAKWPRISRRRSSNRCSAN